MQMCSLELKPQIKQEELSTLFFFVCFCWGREEGRGKLFFRKQWFLGSWWVPALPCSRAEEHSRAREADTESSMRLLHMCKSFSLGTWKRLIWMAQFVLKWGWVLFSGSCILKGVVLSLWLFPQRHSPQHGRCLNTQLTCWRNLCYSQTIFSLTKACLSSIAQKLCANYIISNTVVWLCIYKKK